MEPFEPISEPLSPEGERRREEILRSAKGALARRRLLRRARHGALAALLAAALIPFLQRPEKPPAAPSASTPPGTSTAAYTAFRFEEIGNDPLQAAACTVADRPIPAAWMVTDRPIPAETYIGDDDLLRLLAEAGRPAGIARIGGEFRLIEQKK